MSEVPDKVIAKAQEAGTLKGTLKGMPPPVNQAERSARAFAGVIAAWASEQGRTEGAAAERARIRKLVEARIREAGEDYLRDPGAYHRGREGELLMVAYEIGSADTREGENGE